MAKDDKMKKIMSLCKRRGYIFAGSEIYGGLANTWDYGPYGVQLKKNIKDLWWKTFVTSREDIVGLDSSILLNPEVWKASGHLGSFSDPLMDCKNCKERVRGDDLIEAKLGEGSANGKTLEEITQIVKENNIKCPKCGKSDFTEARAFNLMFKTFQGVVEEKATEIYLRPETAQGIFINFKNIYSTMRKKVPFGVGQIGKSFRNEITPGNFIFRTREFEQMELEYFCKPGTEMDYYKHWQEFCMNWLLSLGVNKDKIRMRDHEQKELSHYSNATCDIEYEFPFGWGELWGIASRTDFDLKQHIENSKQDLSYIDQAAKEKYVPFVIEPALGVDRLALTLLVDAYDEEDVNDSKRVVMRFNSKIAPLKAAVFPLMRKDELKEVSKKIYTKLLEHLNVEYDEIGSIGKRYRRHDELGTPYCITVDYDSLEDNSVTIRERDTMKQERVSIDNIISYLIEKL